MRLPRPIAVALLSFGAPACGTASPRPPPAPSAPPPAAAVPAARPAPAGAPPAAAPVAVPAPVPSPAPSPAAVPAAPRTFRETVADLLRAARGGADPALAAHVDLMEAIDRLGPDAPEDTAIVRDKEHEAATTAAHGRGTALAATASFFEPGGDAAALRRVFLDFDRTLELTGKAGTRLVSRSGPVSLGETDATRKILWLTYSARWRFEARELDRGSARLFVSTTVPWDGTDHVLESRGLFLAVPERGGVRVAHATVSAVDFEIPGIARGAAASLAEREIRERVDGLRAHWREYVR